MARLVIDTIVVKNSCEDINVSSNDYKQNIDSIFDKLTKLEDYGLWVGDQNNSSVKKYIEKSKIEKNMYIEYYNSLIKYANQLKNYATEIENIVTNGRIG